MHEQFPRFCFADHVSNYSDDLDTDDLASFLNNWEDTSSDAVLKTPGRPYAQEKLNPIMDVPVGMPSEPAPEHSTPAPPMDVEADFTVGEKMSYKICKGHIMK